jgi:hypothetical protein
VLSNLNIFDENFNVSSASENQLKKFTSVLIFLNIEVLNYRGNQNQVSIYLQQISDLQKQSLNLQKNTGNSGIKSQVMESHQKYEELLVKWTEYAESNLESPQVATISRFDVCFNIKNSDSFQLGSIDRSSSSCATDERSKLTANLNNLKISLWSLRYEMLNYFCENRDMKTFNDQVSILQQIIDELQVEPSSKSANEIETQTGEIEKKYRKINEDWNELKTNYKNRKEIGQVWCLCQCFNKACIIKNLTTLSLNIFNY